MIKEILSFKCLLFQWGQYGVQISLVLLTSILNETFYNIK